MKNEINSLIKEASKRKNLTIIHSPTGKELSLQDMIDKKKEISAIDLALSNAETRKRFFRMKKFKKNKK